MCNIGMEKTTNGDPPELKAVPEFGEELVLQLVERAVPCEVVLRFGVVEDEQDDEKDEEED